jgi:hypothetical protein
MPFDEGDSVEDSNLTEEQLEIERLDILSTIGQLSNNLDLTDKEACQRLRFHERAYNDIIDRIQAAKGLRLFDPLDKLPLEIWQTILYNVVSFTIRPRITLFYRSIPDDILVFMLVSKRWLRSIINTPFFWNTIFLNADAPDNLARMKMNLEFSIYLPLFLRIAIPFPQWIEAVPFLAENRHRIRCIEISSHTPKYGESKEAVSEVEAYLKDLLPLPTLTRFDLVGMNPSHGTSSLVQTVLLRCPSFNYIMSPHLPREILELDSALQLRSFQTTQDLSELVQKRFPNLFRVNFSHSMNQQCVESTTEDHSLAWQHFGFMTLNTPPPLALVSKLMNLVTFEAPVNGLVFKELLCRLHLMTRLNKLTLRIAYEEQYKNLFPSDTEIGQCRSTTILDLRFNSILGPRSTIKDINIYFDRVQELLLKAFPSTEELTIRSSHVFPVHFIDSRTFSRLSVLYLDSIPQPNTEITLSPSIESLYFIASNSWLRGFPKFSSPSLRRLTMDSWIYSTAPGSTDLQAMFEPEKWAALYALCISAHHISEISTGFECLRSLVLGISVNIYSRRDPSDDPITRFCRNFAMDPSQLPALENLGLVQLPEWDIFFIMLERRNIPKMKGIAKLRKITIPSHYPKELSGPMRDLIRGRFATRPSNWDLSLAGQLDLLEDNTM